jgi:hypothetical protein
MQSFTEKLFHALVASAATSEATGLTAAQLADKYGFPRKDTSTILGNIHRKKLANRSYQQTHEGLRGEYRYWLVKDAEKKAMFYAGHGPRGQRRIRSMQVEREMEQINRNINGGENYVMTITGPHDFAMKMTVTPEKLSGVIGAANGGQ